MLRRGLRPAAGLTALMAALAAPTLLSGCEKAPGNAPRAIVVAASATMNEPGPVLASADRALLRNAGVSSTRGAAYVVDPNTGQATQVPLTPRRPDGQVEYGPARSSLLTQNVDQVQRLLDRQAADKPFDLLAWIAQAVRVTPGPATLLVLSSGLSTAGGFDLRQVGWGTDPHAAALKLRRLGLLPVLGGWHVVFSGLGDTAGRQPSLPLPQRTVLGRYWLAICQEAGAASCAIDAITRADPPSRSTTAVPVVGVPQVHSVRGPHGQTLTSVPADAFFAFNSARLLPGADAVLGPVANQAHAHDLAVSITGYASPDGGTGAYNLALSTARARAVRARLVALGVPARQIAAVIGAGTAGEPRSACYRQRRLDEAICARLRRVVIVLSPTAATS
jgi:outer membrane protein OmpA-like peptidoglycan-associated protein